MTTGSRHVLEPPEPGFESPVLSFVEMCDLSQVFTFLSASFFPSENEADIRMNCTDSFKESKKKKST